MNPSSSAIPAASPENSESFEPCDLCGATRFKPVAQQGGFWIYRCRECRLIQVRPLPAETQSINQDYWHVDLDNPSTRVSRWGSRCVYLHGLRRLEKWTGESIRGKRLLDVGCGMGLFLEIAMEQGAIPHGLDLTPEAVQLTRQLCKIETVEQGYFETCPLAPASFDIITAWGVLHHTRSPSQWLARAYDLLVPGGILLVKMPNVAFTAAVSKWSPLLRLLHLPTSHYLASRPPLNLYGFTDRTLEGLLKKASFEVLTVESAHIRGNAGFLGGLTRTASAAATALTLGRVNFSPVILGIARKPKE
jgi:2-polyprenyl-3-methyl-5-hydroxy-6-metoxy-1,4-benzoquinol methylase